MALESTFINDLNIALESEGEQLIYKKGEYLTRQGEIETHLYFIEKGAIKVYYLSDSDEHIIRLGYNGSFLNSLSSYFKEEPSELFIEAIKQTHVKRIAKSKLEKIFYRNEQSIKDYSQFLENLLSQQLDREIDLLISSSTERLKRVLERSPKLFEHIPLKYIASYLRMQPETLTRIRNY